MSIDDQTLRSTPSATVIGQLGELEGLAEDYPAARALLITCSSAALVLVFFEEPFAQPDGLGGHLD